MFELIGYREEYQVQNKYLGFIPIDIKDYDEARGVDYYSRRTFVLEQDVSVKKGKRNVTIKAGTEVTTIIYPLNGKFIKS